jgi:hypothetical protein
MTKICICGCKQEIIFKTYHKWYNVRFIHGHNARGQKRKPRSFETLQKIAKANLGRHHTEEAKQKISLVRKGKTYIELYGNERAQQKIDKMSKTQKGRPVSLERRLRISKTLKKWTKEKILNTLDDLFEKYGDIKKSDLYGQGKLKHLICHESCIRREFGSFDKAAKYINRDFSKKRRWQIKERFIGDVLKQFYPDIEYHKYHKSIGWPDYETDTTIYDAKSCLNDIKSNQIDKYMLIKKQIILIPFEDRGHIPKNMPVQCSIKPIKHFINELPFSKKEEFIKSYELICNV